MYLHLDDHHYHLTRCNVQAVARTRIHATLPSISAHSISTQDVVRRGLWITRGNGLSLRIRADFNAFATSSTFNSHLLDDLLCETLPLAKLWSQLSLRASLIQPHRARSEPFNGFEVTFALTHTDLPSLEPLATATDTHRVIAAGLHPVKPPVGVLHGSVDAIELVLIFGPLSPLHLALRPFSTRATLPCPSHEGCPPVPDLLRTCTRSSTTASHSSSDRLQVNLKDLDGDLLFQSPKSIVLTAETLLPDRSKTDMAEPDMVPSPTTGPRQFYRPLFPPPSSPPNIQIEQRLMLSQSTLDSPTLMGLLDLSMRHTLGSIVPSCKALTRLNDNAIDPPLVKAVSNISLADISPALFRPGYMKAIAQRAHLIARIASSIFSISSRSRTRHPLCSDSVAESPSPTASGPVKPSQLQIQLWYLLQKRKWPTEALEPLDQMIIGTCNRYEQDPELMLDSEGSERVPWKFQETDDEIMLDPGIELIGDMDEDDEDLFSTYEGTPCWSQDTASLDMMLESDEDEEMMLEGDLLSLPRRYDDELQAHDFLADQTMDDTETKEDMACIEDVEFELLAYDCEDEEDMVSMMLL
ncbi:MAG: hypothetical protein Q9168_000677 [Polycauliona sp. 1 TL-2023]